MIDLGGDVAVIEINEHNAGLDDVFRLGRSGGRRGPWDDEHAALLRCCPSGNIDQAIGDPRRFGKL